MTESPASTAGASAAAVTTSASETLAPEERRVIFASSLGTLFEWYDFFLYAVLAPFFAGLFFPPGNATAALLSAFATYAAGFLVRPFGALIFGRIGDLIGRKYSFLITIVVMGASTFAVGLLPTYAAVGALAPLLLVSLRLLQGLAVGGEYGGAATYVAEHAMEGRRGYDTSWIQATATLALLLALIMIALCRGNMDAAAFKEWGWRIPFLLSAILLAVSVYIRLKLHESPVFQRMKAEGRGSKSPLTDSFFRYPNNKYVLLALFGATAGQAVIWYTGHFYTLFFLTITLKLDYVTAYTVIGASLVLGTPLFVLFGWLSDKIGRLKIMLAGSLLAAVTYLPLFQALTHYANPALEAYQDRTKITVAADDCSFHIFILPSTRFTECDRAKNFLTESGLSFESLPVVPGQAVVTRIGDLVIEGWQSENKTRPDPRYVEALNATGYPSAADSTQINYGMTVLILFVLLVYVAMTYGPMAAFLVELFPTRIRYTSLSLPYHIGNGWFGGLLPLLATAMVAASGNIYYGLWYPIGVAAMTLVIGTLFLRETKDRSINDG
ncbi:MAG: MFS transporter [Nevskiales bacterium]|nr:MFS transporter [Nevskiales bacterium]